VQGTLPGPAEFLLCAGSPIPNHPGAMAHPSIDVRYVAGLARLELTEEEMSTFGKQLDAILGYMEKLAELDVEGIDPTAHPAPVFDRVDPDEPVPGLENADLITNAPDHASGQIRVPKVVADA